MKLLRLLAVLSLLTIAHAAQTTFDILQANQDAILPSSKQHAKLLVLGYVTPWNPRGQALVTQFKDKFDIVSPVWYTVHASKSHHAAKYTVRGGPPASSDEQWYRSLQPKIKVTPRFVLDGWTQEDYLDLLSNATLWDQLASPISAEVSQRGYDGIVFESTASHLLHEPLQVLSEALHDERRAFIVVLPPIRTDTSTGKMTRTFESQNAMILQSLPGLSRLADYITIMTYDMTGAGGRETGLAGSMFPNDSPLRGAKKGTLRTPGPNTHSRWVRENLIAAIEASVGAETMAANLAASPDDPFAGQGVETSPPDVAGKFLMGLPMYGYTYPVFWLNKKTGQGVVAEPGVRTTAIPILRGPGQPLTLPAILDLLEDHQPTIQHDGDASFFDYMQEAPEGHGVREGEEVYWRAYLPTSDALATCLDAMGEVKTALSDEWLSGGVALWEVGQSSTELLSVL